MNLNQDLVWSFARTFKDPPKQEDKGKLSYGEAKISNGRVYVKLDGSSLLTPVVSTVDVADGERVTVMIQNHTAFVIGNATSPAARSESVSLVRSELEITRSEMTSISDRVDEIEISGPSGSGSLSDIGGNFNLDNTSFSILSNIEVLDTGLGIVVPNNTAFAVTGTIFGNTLPGNIARPKIAAIRENGVIVAFSEYTNSMVELTDNLSVTYTGRNDTGDSIVIELAASWSVSGKHVSAKVNGYYFNI